MRDVVIVDAVRTPIGSFRGALADVRADHLATTVLKALSERSGVAADAVGDHHVFRGLDLGYRFGPARKKGGGFVVARKRQAVERIHRGSIDGDRNELAVDLRENAMGVRSPSRELRQVGVDRLGIGMEDVGSILVHQNAGIVVPVVGVARDMGTPVDQQDLVAQLAGEPFCEHAAGETCADDEPIKQETTFPALNVDRFRPSTCATLTICCVSLPRTGLDTPRGNSRSLAKVQGDRHAGGAACCPAFAETVYSGSPI